MMTTLLEPDDNEEESRHWCVWWKPASGEIVYAHAGGVGIRSGDPADVERLLLAGLYHQAQLDERGGREDDAAALIEMAARRFPSEPAVQVMAAQSLLEHRHDPAAALALLRTVTVASDDRPLHFRREWLTADALEALGQADTARATLLQLRTEFPQSARLWIASCFITPGADPYSPLIVGSAFPALDFVSEALIRIFIRAPRLG